MSNNERTIPGRTEALEIMEKLNLPPSIKRHSIKVAEKAMEIANKINKAEINKPLIEAGALLHDIGRSETHGFNHALAGGEILRSKGLSEDLARICETHILGGLDKEDAREVGLPERSYVPETIEEKIVCLADKHILEEQEVSVEERFKQWFNKYGRTKILVKSKKRVEKFQKELKKLT
jgi:uncharacterized protein